jgi:hypothetical protein
LRATIVALVSLALMFAASAAAIRVRSLLPSGHLSEEAKDVVTRGVGFVVTLAALVLSLLIASGKASYDEIGAKLRQLAIEFVLVDRSLAHYGPETREIRDLLRRTMASGMENIWPGVVAPPPTLQGESARTAIERVQDMTRELKPANDAQRVLQSEALREIVEIKRAGLLLIELRETRMPTPFLIIIVVWLLIVFFGFGLFAPRNRTVNAALLFCAFCAAGALFLILELYAPINGALGISPNIFGVALEEMGQ